MLARFSIEKAIPCFRNIKDTGSDVTESMLFSPWSIDAFLGRISRATA